MSSSGVRGSAAIAGASSNACCADIADSFEEVWRERADLADRLEELESEASKHRELESLLRATLVSAERAAQDMKEQARRESDLIVQEAHAEGRRVTRATSAEKDRLEEEIRRIRAFSAVARGDRTRTRGQRRKRPRPSGPRCRATSAQAVAARRRAHPRAG